MCGIVGIVDFAARPIDEPLVRQMCSQLAHRGPDEQGVVCLPSAGERSDARATMAFGSRRLSIIDVKGGRQPIANEDRTVWTVLNGEIYNFRELREELEQKGHHFSTQTDTEVIVHLYEDRGEQFVEALDGMFALALWDDRRQRLILARDRFGKKPLVYTTVGERIMFASEFQALLLDPEIPRDIDREALDYYLTYLAIPAPLSIYQAIRKVPPAHVLVYDRRGMRLRRYWSLAYHPKLQVSEPEAMDTIRELLTAAVKKRLMGEVPLGVFLSGGIDSSAIVALMAAVLGRGPKTFSIGFDDERYNELPYAQDIAERFECEHHAFIVSLRVIDVLPKLIEHFGEPFADASALPTFYLSQITRQHVTVVLNGDGGDEVFAGYGRHLANRLVERWQQEPGFVRGPVTWIGRQLARGGRHPQAWPTRLRRFLDASDLPRADRYRRWVGVFSRDLKASLLATTDGFPAERGMVENLFREAEGDDPVDAALAVDTAFYLPTDLLVKMDIMTMANSLEARSPFLDQRLVEFVARLPSHLKLRGFTSKYILKRTLAGSLPRPILGREKHGFAVPIGQWFRTGLREMVCDHLLSTRCAQRGFFRPAAVEQLVSDHLRGRSDYAHQIWTLLILELWCRRFIDAWRPQPVALGIPSHDAARR